MDQSHKYNWGVVGQDMALQSIEHDIETDNLTHAYLFSGTDSVGKFLTAKRFAHILQCNNNYCDNCDACREIANGYHSDTIELEDGGESVKIEQIRKIIERLNITKQSPYKVFLLQNLERLTLESSNALLKTLEDPPENVIFLLTTSHEGEILSTILSRVRVVKFGRLSNEALIALIKTHFPQTDEKTVDLICKIALGRPGKAISLLNDDELFETYKKMYEDVESLLNNSDRLQQFQYIDELSSKIKDAQGSSLAREFLDVLQLVLRNHLLMDIGGKNGILSRKKVLSLLKTVYEAQEHLKHNVNTRLLLENMMLSL